VALSRPKQGFESPMGHILPHAFTAWGSLFFSVELAAAHIIRLLYAGTVLPPTPLSGKTPRKSARNEQIKTLYAEGASAAELSKHYGISENRVYQILQGRRK
jgi:hypothetical protein